MFPTMAGLTLSSSAFKDGSSIPAKYTCDGENVSPPLELSTPPAGTASLVVILDDPDAPGSLFTHWIVFNIMPTIRSIPEGAKTEEFGTKATEGTNDFGRTGYGGPCPPPGRPHHYNLLVYAIDQFLSLKAGAKRAEIDRAIRGHVLAQGKIIGIYRR